jgi:hypothetical protein
VLLYTVKGARGKVSFDSQNAKYAKQLSCDASLEVYLSHLIYQMTNAPHSYTLSYKYASDEASQDHCEAYLSFCESNDTLPRAPFTVYSNTLFKFFCSNFWIKKYLIC